MARDPGKEEGAPRPGGERRQQQMLQGDVLKLGFSKSRAECEDKALTSQTRQRGAGNRKHLASCVGPAPAAIALSPTRLTVTGLVLPAAESSVPHSGRQACGASEAHLPLVEAFL